MCEMCRIPKLFTLSYKKTTDSLKKTCTCFRIHWRYYLVCGYFGSPYCTRWSTTVTEQLNPERNRGLSDAKLLLRASTRVLIRLTPFDLILDHFLERGQIVIKGEISQSRVLINTCQPHDLSQKAEKRMDFLGESVVQTCDCFTANQNVVFLCKG
jgi:hypothetical protein